MGAWSNEVTITVEQVFDVKSASISAERSSVAVGEEARFSGRAVFTSPAPGSGCVFADIYVDGEKTREGVVVGSYSSGESEASIGFSLVFDEPGTYRVQAYVYTGPCGVR